MALVSGFAALIMQVDSYMLERRQKVAQMEFQARLKACEESGGRWFKGDCEPVP